MDKNGVFGEILETGKQAASSAGKGIKQTASDFANSATGQITGDDSGSNEDLNGAQKGMTDDQAQQFLRDLYGAPDKSQEPKKDETPPQQAVGITPKDPNEGKTPEELAKIEALRKQLHGDYYQTLVNPPKPKEEPVAEKLEREEKEERWDLQEKEAKKPPPLAVQNVQKTEKNPGASG